MAFLNRLAYETSDFANRRVISTKTCGCLRRHAASRSCDLYCTDFRGRVVYAIGRCFRLDTMCKRRRWRLILASRGAELYTTLAFLGPGLNDATQSIPEIAACPFPRNPVVRQLWCAQPVLRECPAEARADIARPKPREPRSDTAGLAAHSEW